MALITSWATFPFALELDGTNSAGGSGIFSQLLHLPAMAMPDMMDVAIVFHPVPDKIAVIYLAKRATPQSLTQVGTAWDCLGEAVDNSIFPIMK